MDNFHISTWNVEGKGSPEEVEKILSQSSAIKSEQSAPNIICVQQANLPTNEESLNYKWLCSGKFGSAVLISKASSLKSGSVEQICEQICVAEVITDTGKVMKVISCYIPPSTDYITKDLWTKLSEIIKTIPCNLTYVIAGDFNAEIGGEDDFPTGVGKGIVGLKLFHKNSNENGIQLKKLAIGLHAIIVNTIGELSSNAPMYTYKDGAEKSQRSFIMVPYDRVPSPYKVLLHDSKLTFNSNYRSAILSKGLKFTMFEKFAKLVSSQVVVSSWNVHGASPSVIDKVLSEYELPVVCVQDLFLTSDLDVETKNYTWFTSRKLWSKNVGIVVKTSPDISMTNFEVLSESLCVGDITLNGDTIKVICCCLPPHADSTRFQEVTDKLTDLVKNIPQEIVYVVAGDFNTHVTYTVIDDELVFDEGDENASFLQKIMGECNMELQYMSKMAVTQISETARRNSNHILMSASCTLKYSHRRYVRWVPFFENGVVILNLPDYDIDENGIQLDFPAYTKAPTSEIKEVVKVEHVDGFIYTTRKFCRLRKYITASTSNQQAFRFINADYAAKLPVNLPSEIVDKYKNSPPPIEELLRILGNGFTLYFGFLQESSLPKGYAGVLAASFEYLKRGILIAECIDVSDDKTQTPVKRIVNLRWNGIVVHQQEGGKFVNYKSIINKGQKDFINKLGQHFFTVKAKASFYNNGLPPLCQDKAKLDEVLRLMKRSDFPPSATVGDVQKFISEFVSRNPCVELVFGPDFSLKHFLTPIKRYVTSKGIRMRWFKSSNDLQTYDSMSIFIDRSPQEIRKRLMGTDNHQDLRFQLLPPCGTDKNYHDWIGDWAEKTIPDEYFKLHEESAETTEFECTKNSGSPGIIKPASVEDIIKKQLERKKHRVGFVRKDVRITRKLLKYTITKCTNLVTGNSTLKVPKGRRDWINVVREESDLPQEIVNKYCENEIPIKELSRILGSEFILYFGFRRESSVVSQSMEVLAESFESTDRGGVMAEYIQVDKSGEPFKRIVKFKWNGICIHQQDGSVNDSFKNISQKGQVTLIDKLGRNFDAVKAKMSYYNKGLAPICEDKDKLNEVLRIVKKSDFPPTAGIDEVKKFINEFFSEDTYMELVFGPEFSVTEFLDPIKKYAVDKDIGYRLFKSTEDLKHWDNISLFIKRSALEVHGRLTKLPENHDLRFYLVPPCEFSNRSHYDWTKYWTSEVCAEEFKLVREREDEVQKSTTKSVTKQKTSQNQVKEKPSQQPRDSSRKDTRPQSSRTVAQKRRRQQVDRKNQNSRSQLSRSDVQRRSRQPIPNVSRPQLFRSDIQRRSHQPIQEVSRLQLSRSDVQRRSREPIPEVSRSQLSRSVRQELSQREMDYYRENSYPQSSRPVRQEQEVFSWQQMDYYEGDSYSKPYSSDEHNLSERFREQMHSLEPVGRKRGWEEMDLSEEVFHSQPSRSDDYDTSNRYENEDYNTSNRYINQDYDTLNQYKNQDYDISGRFENQEYIPQPERYVPQSKRAKGQPMATVDKPRWDDIGPLVIVWPVNIRSENETDSRKVLEANFPTEISLEPNNRVAVYVTLPLRKTRRDKKYCLCIGNGVHRATKQALEMIVKRSSVIKYNLNFLPPDGLVPNFIRYNVPCQTNPRTYVMVGWKDTGALTGEKILELFDSFKVSLNEDLFFDKDGYTHEMKLKLIDLAPKCGLKVRHFGNDHRLINRYICVYKTKEKNAILEEVLRMRDFHPKYKLNTNKLPPRLGLNIF